MITEAKDTLSILGAVGGLAGVAYLMWHYRPKWLRSEISDDSGFAISAKIEHLPEVLNALRDKNPVQYHSIAGYLDAVRELLINGEYEKAQRTLDGEVGNVDARRRGIEAQIGIGNDRLSELMPQLKEDSLLFKNRKIRKVFEAYEKAEELGREFEEKYAQFCSLGLTEAIFRQGYASAALYLVGEECPRGILERIFKGKYPSTSYTTKAISHFGTVLNRDSGHGEASYFMGLCKYIVYLQDSTGNDNVLLEAEQYFENVRASLGSNSPPVLKLLATYNLGLIHRETGELIKAMQMFGEVRNEAEFFKGVNDGYKQLYESAKEVLRAVDDDLAEFGRRNVQQTQSQRSTSGGGVS